MLVAVVVSALIAGAAGAQEAALLAEAEATAPAPAATDSPTLEQLVKAAREAGATILIDGQSIPAAGTTATAHPAAALEGAVAVRLAVAETLARIPSIPGAMAEAARKAHHSDSASWLWWSLGLTAIALVVGLAAWWFVWRWAKRVLARMEARQDTMPAPRTTHALSRTGFAILADLALLFAGVAVVVLLVPTAGPVRASAIVVLLAVSAYRLVVDMLTAFFMPDRDSVRLLRLDAATARRMLRQLKVITACAYVILGLMLWSTIVGVDPRTVDALQILSAAVTVVLLIVFLMVHRKTITALVRGTSQRPNTFRKFIGTVWPAIAVAYLVLGAAVHVTEVVSGAAPQVGPILAPILATIAGLAVYGVCVIILARRFNATEATLKAAMQPAPPSAPAQPPASPAEEATAEVAPVEPDTEPLLVWQARWHALFRRLAGLAAVVIGCGIVVVSLGILDFGTAVSESLGLVVVLFATWGLYDAMRTWIDGRIEDEAPGHGHGESEDGMGPGASRLATLLPLLRNLLIVTMFTFMAAVGLAALGVNVAPLFAGAGVVGLAVGFGAQTLIRDIFSGAFFLADDAFRKGEYIDVGGIMGAVEKISVRSFQLRHHNGPLHTIPFGEIKQLTNFSRDWVVMKLPLRIAYGTNVERVRKLIKKLGQEMLEDPEIGPLFMDPLKSQGVIEMEDSAMILRVKFMTKPGDQFVVRRHVYTRIGELFEREGIQFAHRYVTVRIDPRDREDLTPEEEQQAAAAAAGQVLNQDKSKK
ncbi:mechanosensitive ion channel family protein [Acuticoccus sp. I52.16.1]|uniref:mechanosensitive ion channel family protein n=1 Tax=Acuticoccus sp. I52.16.1 TaxID=2928472 RepID=UPI001FD5C762|nr:mechanosensitive ion channel domain-containing protein [Acuticoccus sp. I52.16.1]UOM36234.1 mechanosensitive ion channel family protein [Acuticoccus sp. I52.16.1]